MNVVQKFFINLLGLGDQLKEPAQEPEYVQENGELITISSEEVEVLVADDNSNIEIVPRLTPRVEILPTKPVERIMGGEEIRPGTLHVCL